MSVVVTETARSLAGASQAAGAAAVREAAPLAVPSAELPPVPEKRYFRIGEVARIVGVEAHVLRYWEREFRQIRPEKSQRGQRVYSRADVGTLRTIRELLYTQGFTIAGAKKRLSGRGLEAVDEGHAVEPAPIAAPAPAVVAAPMPAPLPVPVAAAPPRLSPEIRAALVDLREELTALLAALES